MNELTRYAACVCTKSWGDDDAMENVVIWGGGKLRRTLKAAAKDVRKARILAHEATDPPSISKGPRSIEIKILATESEGRPFRNLNEIEHVMLHGGPRRN